MSAPTCPACGYEHGADPAECLALPDGALSTDELDDAPRRLDWRERVARDVGVPSQGEI